MAKKIIILFVCAIMLTACGSQRDKNEKALIDSIKAKDNNAEVALSDITPFKWDKAYSFGPYTSEEEVQKTIGFEAKIHETVSEGMPHMVFVKDDEVVCEIMNYPSNMGIDIHAFSGTIDAKDGTVFKVEKQDEIVCITEKTTDLTEDEIWTSISNKEWSTLEGAWPLGFGIYFYEEGNTRYALCMTYGSGLAVIDASESKITMRQNRIFLDLPKRLFDGKLESEDPVRVMLIFDDGNLNHNGLELECDSEHPAFHYNEWLKLK